MSTAKHRKGNRVEAVALGLALGLCSIGPTLSSAQPPDLPQERPSFGAPIAIESPPLIDTASVSSALPTSSDPVSRVPNFFGNFVARPGFAFVNQPAVSTTMTNTLTYFGLPTDVAGGNGSNIFYSAFRPNGIVGPGGPYDITSNIVGIGLPGPPKTSILFENAELTGLINAKFPGATFAGGTGPLFPPFLVMFDYLDSATATTPGLVALVNVSNPAGGGLVGRNKYFDDGSPLPQDRVFFDYNHVGAFGGPGAATFDVNRYVFGVEKTFLGGFGSIEVLLPFAGTANSDQNGGLGQAVDHLELGNVGLLLKAMVFRNANWAVSAGVGLSTPTADDSRVLFRGVPVLEIRNDALLLQPIFGVVWAPNDRFYMQAGLQLDFDANGNPVYVRSPGGDFSQRGVLTDQTYLYASGAVGYWVYQADAGMVSGISLQGELHYNRTISKRDFVQTGSVLVADLGSDVDVLDATAGVNILLGDRATLSLGVSFPLSGDRLYDWNLMAHLNYRFGPGSR